MSSFPPDTAAQWENKAVCKRALQEAFGLPADNALPLIATISRLADQKGFDLIVIGP